MVQSQGLVTRAEVEWYWSSSSLANSFGVCWCGSAGGAAGRGEPSQRGALQDQGVPALEDVAPRGFGAHWEELVNPFASLPQVCWTLAAAVELGGIRTVGNAEPQDPLGAIPRELRGIRGWNSLLGLTPAWMELWMIMDTPLESLSEGLVSLFQPQTLPSKSRSGSELFTPFSGWNALKLLFKIRNGD